MIVLQCASTTIELPEADELPIQQYDMQTRVKRSMTGVLRTWRKRPCRSIWIVAIRMLTIERYEDLRNFLRNFHGRVWLYTNNENETRKVRLMEDPVGIELDTHFSRTLSLKLGEVDR